MTQRREWSTLADWFDEQQGDAGDLWHRTLIFPGILIADPSTPLTGLAAGAAAALAALLRVPAYGAAVASVCAAALVQALR